MRETVGIIWNPVKIGEAELRRACDEALAGAFLTEDEQPECLWFETTAEDAGQGMVRDAIAAGCTLIIAAGGDGTVRAVAEQLGGAGQGADSGESVFSDEHEGGGSRADLGIVPLGTGNLLARNLGIPLGRPQAAFERIFESEGEPVDLGEVSFTIDDVEQTQGFVVMVGFGIDAQMIAETDDDLKSKAGWLAYVESLGRAAAGIEVVDVSLTLDDNDELTRPAHTMLVANCGSIQGGITLLPDASPNDGELDMLLLGADNAGSWLDTMKNMVWDNGIMRAVGRSQTAQSSDTTTHLRGRSVRAELPQPLAFQIDGDAVGEVSRFSVRILPGALRVR